MPEIYGSVLSHPTGPSITPHTQPGLSGDQVAPATTPLSSNDPIGALLLKLTSNSSTPTPLSPNDPIGGLLLKLTSNSPTPAMGIRPGTGATGSGLLGTGITPAPMNPFFNQFGFKG